MKYLVLFPLFFVQIIVHGQIRVSDSEDITEVVKRLEGPGVKISNITYRFSPHALRKPAGAFRDNFGFTGLEKGLLLTTGALVNALGPNNSPYITQVNHDPFQDPDLIPYIEDYDSKANAMNDECYVEFDLVSASPVISFNYVFASEEYTETMIYHDVLALLISGPGITGKKNIAVVPGTEIPVSVGSINPFTNSQYYLSNGTGSIPYINIDMQYDGYTQVMQATTEVIPCKTYHLKLAIADVLDDTYDAGVFIEEGSIKAANAPAHIVYEHPKFNYAIEGCNKAFVVFERPAWIDLIKEVQYNYIIKGTATNGIDYSSISTSLTIPPGQGSAYVTLSALQDGVSDEEEFVRLVIPNDCPYFPDLADSIDVPIKETFPYFIPPEKTCNDESVILNKSANNSDSILWDASPFLNCQKCLSPTATPAVSMYFPYTVKDVASGCLARDSVHVEALKVKADFNFFHDPCHTSLDFIFQNKSQNATYYRWDFGDNASSESPDPIHQYPLINTRDKREYQVTLIAGRENTSCTDDSTITVTIDEPFFLPNLITKNKDGRNDFFKILGANTECWTFVLYSRWGNLVYKEENYRNDFSGENLPSGVYYYSLQNSMRDREFNGWVEIINE